MPTRRGRALHQQAEGRDDAAITATFTETRVDIRSGEPEDAVTSAITAPPDTAKIDPPQTGSFIIGFRGVFAGPAWRFGDADAVGAPAVPTVRCGRPGREPVAISAPH